MTDVRAENFQVSEAEKYAAEDASATARIAARNSLESLTYNLRNSVEGDLKDKIDPEDKVKLDAAIKESMEWLGKHSILLLSRREAPYWHSLKYSKKLDQSAEASEDEYKSREKELTAISNPIVSFTIYLGALSWPLFYAYYCSIP